MENLLFLGVPILKHIRVHARFTSLQPHPSQDFSTLGFCLSSRSLGDTSDSLWKYTFNGSLGDAVDIAKQHTVHAVFTCTPAIFSHHTSFFFELSIRRESVAPSCVENLYKLSEKYLYLCPAGWYSDLDSMEKLGWWLVDRITLNAIMPKHSRRFLHWEKCNVLKPKAQLNNMAVYLTETTGYGNIDCLLKQKDWVEPDYLILNWTVPANLLHTYNQSELKVHVEW